MPFTCTQDTALAVPTYMACSVVFYYDYFKVHYKIYILPIYVYVVDTGTNSAIIYAVYLYTDRKSRYNMYIQLLTYYLYTGIEHI